MDHKDSRHQHVLAIGMTLLVSTIVGAFAFYSGFAQGTIHPLVTPTPTLITKATASTVEDTAHWKIYAGAQGDFTIKYPSDWETKLNRAEETYFKPINKTYEVAGSNDVGIVTISYCANNTHYDPRDYTSSGVGTWDNIQIAGKKGYKVTYPSGRIDYAFNTDKSCILINNDIDDIGDDNASIAKNSAIFDQMLTTLQFTK